VKDGLGDREPGVRVAAGKLVMAWFDVVLSEAGKDNEESDEGEEEWQGDDSGVMKGLAKFLSLFDVVGPGEAVAVNAVLSIFTTRRELPDVFVFAGTLIPSGIKCGDGIKYRSRGLLEATNSRICRSCTGLRRALCEYQKRTSSGDCIFACRYCLCVPRTTSVQ